MGWQPGVDTILRLLNGSPSKGRWRRRLVQRSLLIRGQSPRVIAPLPYLVGQSGGQRGLPGRLAPRDRHWATFRDGWQGGRSAQPCTRTRFRDGISMMDVLKFHGHAAGHLWRPSSALLCSGGLIIRQRQ